MVASHNELAGARRNRYRQSTRHNTRKKCPKWNREEALWSRFSEEHRLFLPELDTTCNIRNTQFTLDKEPAVGTPSWCVVLQMFSMAPKFSNLMSHVRQRDMTPVSSLQEYTQMIMVEEEAYPVNKYMNRSDTHQPPSSAANYAPMVEHTRVSGHPQRRSSSHRTRGSSAPLRQQHHHHKQRRPPLNNCIQGQGPGFCLPNSSSSSSSSRQMKRCHTAIPILLQFTLQEKNSNNYNFKWCYYFKQPSHMEKDCWYSNVVY